MCGFPTDYPLSGVELNRAELFSLVNECVDLGTLVLSIGGGEPFLRPETPDLLEHAVDLGLSAAVDTNGSLLTQELVSRLARIPRLTIAMSLDSHLAEVHDGLRGVSCFERIMESARYLVKYAPHVSVLFSFTITSRNIGHLIPVAHLARDLGIRGVRCTPFHHNLQHRHRSRPELTAAFSVPEHEIPRVGEQLRGMAAVARSAGLTTNSEAFLRSIPAFLRGRVPHACYAGFAFCSIDPVGTLIPCYDLMDGPNVRTAGLRAAWRSARMDRLRREVVRCRRRCWNIGNAEPSLRFDPMFLVRNPLQVGRELGTFL